MHFYPNLFISLTYILASASYEVKKKEKSGSATKKPKLTLLENLELLVYPATRKFKGKDVCVDIYLYSYKTD